MHAMPRGLSYFFRSYMEISLGKSDVSTHKLGIFLARCDIFLLQNRVFFSQLESWMKPGTRWSVNLVGTTPHQLSRLFPAPAPRAYQLAAGRYVPRQGDHEEQTPDNLFDLEFAIGYPVESTKLPLTVLGRFQEHGPLILTVINKGQISWNVGLEIFDPIICTLSNYNMVISEGIYIPMESQANRGDIWLGLTLWVKFRIIYYM